MTFLTILIIVGAVQGLVSATLFLSKKNHLLQNRLLSFIIISLSLALVNLVLMDAGVRYQSTALNLLAYIVPLLVVMPVGPLLFYYVTTILEPDFRFNSSVRLHFYPVVFDLLPYVAGIVLATGLITGLIVDESRWRYVIDEYNAYTDVIRWGSLTTYVVLAAKLVRDQSHKADEETTKWLRQLIVVFAIFQLIWLVHLLPYLLPLLRNRFIELITWYPIYIPLSVMIYWLSINGYMRMSVNVRKALALPSETIEETDRLLNQAMERDRLFLDPNMTLSRLAKSIGVSQKIISAFLNQHRGVSFNQFVNTYRVEELKRRLKSPGDQHLTITGLGLECGFNSSATMQRAFRQFVQCSPRQYQLGGS